MISESGATLRVGDRVVEGIRLVIFDKDGTLLELHHYWGQMVRLRAAILREALDLTDEQEAGLRRVMGLDDRTGRLGPDGPVGLKTREVVLAAVAEYLAAQGLPGHDAHCARAFSEADEQSLARLGDFIRVIDGAERLLGGLHTAGCKVALVTVDLHSRAALALEHIGFSASFDLVVGGDEVSRPKPDPEAVERVLQVLDIPPDAAVMVGDALNDVRMGIEAGLAAAIGVLTGFASREQLSAATPLVAESLAGIQVVAPSGAGADPRAVRV
jgi:phosphoglycolate phosphatase-like HAD superfamily hydrolase